MDLVLAWAKSQNFRVSTLLKGSDFKGSYWTWKSARKGYCRYIRSGDCILDIGCANGFLLKCIQLWGSKNVVPYGIDISSQRISQAQHIHHKYPEHFHTKDLFNLVDLHQRFDIIISPWIENKDYNERLQFLLCKYQIRGILFSLYDDDLIELSDFRKRIQSFNWKISSVYEAWNLTMIAEVTS